MHAAERRRLRASICADARAIYSTLYVAGQARAAHCRPAVSDSLRAMLGCIAEGAMNDARRLFGLAPIEVSR